MNDDEWRIDVQCDDCGGELVVRCLGRDEVRPRGRHTYRCTSCDRSGMYPPSEVLALAGNAQRFLRRR